MERKHLRGIILDVRFWYKDIFVVFWLLMSFDEIHWKHSIMFFQLVKSELYLVSSNFQSIVSLLFDEGALMVLIEQCNSRVENPFPILDVRLPGAHLNLVDLSFALLQNELKGRSIPSHLSAQ